MPSTSEWPSVDLNSRDKQKGKQKGKPIGLPFCLF